MGEQRPAVPTVTEVGALLRRGVAFDAEELCPDKVNALVALRDAETSDGDRAAALERIGGDPRCTELMDESTALSAAAAAQPRSVGTSSAAARESAEVIQLATRRRRVAWGVVGLAAAATLLAVLFSPALRSPDEHQPGGRAGGLTAMGGGDKLHLSIKRRAADMRADEEGALRLEDGDRLGFFHTSSRPGYLCVGWVGGDSMVTVHHPRVGADCGPVSVGEELRLESGLRYRRDTGVCEYLVAAFYDEPTSVEAFRAALGNAALPGAGACAPDGTLTLPGARTVEVRPVAPSVSD